MTPPVRISSGGHSATSFPVWLLSELTGSGLSLPVSNLQVVDQARGAQLRGSQHHQGFACFNFLTAGCQQVALTAHREVVDLPAMTAKFRRGSAFQLSNVGIAFAHTLRQGIELL